MKLLQSKWMCVVVGLLLYASVTIAVWQSPQLKLPARKHASGKAGARTKPSWEFQNPEVDQLIAEVQQQKRRSPRRNINSTTWPRACKPSARKSGS